MITLTGDIGGTYTRMQLTEFKSCTEKTEIKTTQYQNKNHQTFIEIIKTFLTEAKPCVLV